MARPYLSRPSEPVLRPLAESLGSELSEEGIEGRHEESIREARPCLNNVYKQSAWCLNRTLLSIKYLPT